MNVEIRSSTAAVPQVFNEVRIDENSQVKSQVGHVAKFHQHEENLSNDNELYPSPTGKVYQISSPKKKINQFLTMNKEELKSYMNQSYWKRLRWTIGVLYLLLTMILLVGAILLIVFSTKCSSKKSLTWYEKDLIYEVDVQMFRDSNGDGQGDIQGLMDKIDYLQKYSFKTILLQPTIFATKPSFDLYQLNEQIANQTHLQSLVKLLRRKDMHLIIDLPLSSTLDTNGSLWYGNQRALQQPIANPCTQQQNESLACQYSLFYGRLPLNFNEKSIDEEAQNRLRYWLVKKNIDGVRVDLPLELNQQTGLYEISSRTIEQWNTIIEEIKKKGQTKLIFFDVPLHFNHFVGEKSLRKKISYPIVDQQIFLDAKQLHQRMETLQQNPTSLTRFWKYGSSRINEQKMKTNLPDEFLLTMAMLIGGTPVILYGEEFGLQQTINRLMLWTPDQPCGGFSTCRTNDCLRLFTLYNVDPSQTNVKRAEAIAGSPRDSPLRLFGYLAKLRQLDSFRYGLLETGFREELNIFWFRRETAGARGYLIVFNLNEEEKPMVHLSLYESTSYAIPAHIKWEYQWPKTSFNHFNQSHHIDADNLFLQSQSISIFSWKEKLPTSKTLFQKGKPQQLMA